MKNVKRFDRGGLGNAVKTPQGFLKVPAYLTRTGILKYKTADGSIRRELRLPDEVFDAQSLATLSGIPVTNDHPPEMINAENAKKYMVGYTHDSVEKDSDKVKSVLTITDADAISSALNGREQVSCGYFADLEEIPGKFDGEEYDAIQRNIRYNHVAIVDRGRAGPEVKMRLDSGDAVLVDGDNNGNKNQGGKKMKITLGGKEYEVSDELHAAIVSEMDKVRASQAVDGAGMKEMKAEMEKKDAKISALEAKVDAQAEDLKKVKTDSVIDPAKITEAVKARRHVEKIAEKVLDEKGLEKLDSMSDLEIKNAVIKAKSPEAVLEGKSLAYVDARFDHIAETVVASDKKATELGKRTDSEKETSDSDVEKARAKMREDSVKAYKEPLSAMKA